MGAIKKNKHLPFDDAQIKKIYGEHLIVIAQLRKLSAELVSSSSLLSNDKAREYMLHGVGRRLSIIRKCIENVFRIFPVARRRLLSSAKLAELEINLHAFVINICGLLDNMAWVFVHDKGLLTKIQGGRKGVDLYKESMQQFLPTDVLSYLKSERHSLWYQRHVKDYRDALAHRIPLYVPPGNLTKAAIAKSQSFEMKMREALLNKDFQGYDKLEKKQRLLQTLCFNYVHSYDEADTVVFFHPQMIADARTIMAILQLLQRHFGRPLANPPL